MDNFHELDLELDSACTDFESLQLKQLETLKSGDLSDLMFLHEDRERAFLRLKACLEKVAADPGISGEMNFLKELQKRIELQLKVGKALDEAAGDCRNTVAGKLGDLRKGKAALKGYSVRRGKAPDARFMSNRG
ncbi:MAG: hypothetical protein KKG47_12180 [Proteobacteria bacterium]|nr:hypothetical protein [Pseudomonadota bacterium]MBU1737699.1 hypothetical protein [Pseudomonadota bacterium]